MALLLGWRCNYNIFFSYVHVRINRQLNDKIDDNGGYVGDKDEKVENVEGPSQVGAFVEDHPQRNHLRGESEIHVRRIQCDDVV